MFSCVKIDISTQYAIIAMSLRRKIKRNILEEVISHREAAI